MEMMAVLNPNINAKPSNIITQSKKKTCNGKGSSHIQSQST
jgi:hypothetical protein